MPAPVHIKICGLREADHAAVAADAGADMIGFVFVEASPRHVTIEQARAVAKSAGDVQCVGVFKDASCEQVQAAVEGVPLDRVQLHGQVTATLIDDLAPTPIVRAISFEPDTIESKLRDADALYHTMDHYAGLLIDTPDPTRLGGGTGQVFDWSSLREVLDRVQPAVPIILAGGLTAENVAEAIETIHPWGVDVSSGVESSRGVKDAQKIRWFCEAARRVRSGG